MGTPLLSLHQRRTGRSLPPPGKSTRLPPNVVQHFNPADSLGISEGLKGMQYVWDEEFQLFRRESWQPLGYSDGVEVEQRLYRVIRDAKDRGTFSRELPPAIIDWPSEYHLSRGHHCLLRPLGIKPGDTVLELGSGCGAITRFLGEIGAQVVAVEGSLLRAQIAAERCRGLSNVRVYADDLLSFATDQRFDWVLLVSVLEYAPLFASGNGGDPVAEYLSSASRFLSPTGRMVVAIENKLGIKYLNGCREDHIGSAFVGVQGLYTQRSAVTFGRHELAERLRAAGLTSTYFYYPFPDHKLPVVILSQDAFSDPDFDATDLLARSHGRDYSGWQYREFDEALALRELGKNQLIADFSNSFLVVAQRKPIPVSSSSTTLAMTFAAYRVPELATQTSFVRDGAAISVVKEPLTAVAERKVTVKNYGVLTNLVGRSAYLPGRQLLWRILSARAAGGRPQEIADAFSPWFELLLRYATSSADGETGGASSHPARLADLELDGKYLDLTPFNVIENDDGLALIDEEWKLDARISAGWVVTRGVMHSLMAGLPSANPLKSITELIQLLCSKFALTASDADVERWLQEEADFQSAASGYPVATFSPYVTSGPLIRIVPKLSSLLQNAADLTAEVASLRQTIASLEARAAQADAASARVTQAEAARAEIEQARRMEAARAEEAAAQAAFFRGELEQAISSRSWKITRPIRDLNAWWRTLFGKSKSDEP